MSAPDASPHALEPIAARAWPAAESAAIGGWRLYASLGRSGRINACWPLAEPGLPLKAAVEAVETWYATRSLPPRFKIAPEMAGAAALEAALSVLGYESRTPTLTMTGPVAQAAPPGGTRLEPVPGGAFAAVFAAASADPEDARERLEALARCPAPRAFAVAERDLRPAAIGAAVVEGPWVGIFAMRTDPALRRLGLARGVLASLFAFAREAGAQRAWLQVEADNAPAVALYAGLGFETAYSYRYWMRA